MSQIHEFQCGNILIAGEEHPNGCWLCTSHEPDSRGYPMASVNGKTRFAHRHVWEAVNGPITDGSHIRHTCDTPMCINPAHLIPGTQQDNMRDKIERGRQAKGEAQGHAKLTEGQVKEILATPNATSKELGAKYNVSREAIQSIRLGHNWKHVPGNRRKLPVRSLTEIEIECIRQEKDLTHKQTALVFRINQSTVSRIKSGKRHSSTKGV